jgi:hypothetical protein
VKLNVTVPLPVPLAPEVTVIHEVLLDAAQEQVLLVETLIDAVEPPRPSRKLVGETEYEHDAGGCGGGGDGGCGDGGCGDGGAGMLTPACVTVGR